MYMTWWKNARTMAMLASEAQSVVTQRMMMFAIGGPKAQAELNLMVREKIVAAAEAGIQIATGESHRAVICGYRRKVRANLKRLSKP